MTAPQVLSCQFDDNASPTPLLYVIFDRNVAALNAFNGWTLTKSPGGTVVYTSVTLQDTAALIQLPGPIGAATLTVAYDDGVGSMVEAALPNDPVASFTTTAIAYPVLGQALRAQAGVPANDAITVTFGEPVAATGGDLLSGFEIEVNGEALDLTSATASLNASQTELTISTGVNFTFNDTINVTYDDSLGELVTYPSGVLVGGFAYLNIQNLSTDGLPTSAYPLSYVFSGPVQMQSKMAIGTLALSLNPIDIELVERYGPAVVLTGGTFGQTMGNPDGISVLGAQVTLADGLQITQSFTARVISYASDAALDWQSVVRTRIGIALGQLRAADQSVTLGTRTVLQV